MACGLVAGEGWKGETTSNSGMTSDGYPGGVHGTGPARRARRAAAAAPAGRPAPPRPGPPRPAGGRRHPSCRPRVRPVHPLLPVEIWAPMRASASARSMPRWDDQPLQGHVGRGVDHHHRVQLDGLAVDGRSGAGWPAPRCRRCRRTGPRRAIIAMPMAGWVMALRSARASGLAEDQPRPAPGPVDGPVGVDDLGPEPVDQRLVGRPARGHHLAGHRSASTSTAPCSTSRSATADLPAPMPPVSPTASTSETLPGGPTRPGGRQIGRRRPWGV